MNFPGKEEKKWKKIFPFPSKLKVLRSFYFFPFFANALHRGVWSKGRERVRESESIVNVIYEKIFIHLIWGKRGEKGENKGKRTHRGLFVSCSILLRNSDMRESCRWGNWNRKWITKTERDMKKYLISSFLLFPSSKIIFMYRDSSQDEGGGKV